MADDPEGELALDLAPSRAQDAKTGGGPAPPRLAYELRLADTSGAFDQDNARLADGRLADDRIERPQLTVTLKQAHSVRKRTARADIRCVKS